MEHRKDIFLLGALSKTLKIALAKHPLLHTISSDYISQGKGQSLQLGLPLQHSVEGDTGCALQLGDINFLLPFFLRHTVTLGMGGHHGACM
jgi:hypothetical protein